MYYACGEGFLFAKRKPSPLPLKEKLWGLFVYVREPRGTTSIRGSFDCAQDDGGALRMTKRGARNVGKGLSMTAKTVMMTIA